MADDTAQFQSDDLLIHEIADLNALVADGTLTPLGEGRYAFTVDHLHNPTTTPFPRKHPTLTVPLVQPFRVDAGAVIALLPDQHPEQATFKFKFDFVGVYTYGAGGPGAYPYSVFYPEG
ncbi:hypothetical protein LCGC14_0165080 [marine sediment metagenome]|uniref:Uncharacterized protein n=1 Tax=marine sediment metagenome TaxID=412755 RepID=A0A0F9UYR5_9ZZZZ